MPVFAVRGWHWGLTCYFLLWVLEAESLDLWMGTEAVLLAYGGHHKPLPRTGRRDDSWGLPLGLSEGPTGF